MTVEARVLSYVEIDIDYCALTYGVLPCTAELGVTGEKKCFNTPATCQDRPNFTNEPVTLRFAVPTDYLPREIDAIGSIKSISFTPSVVSLGGDLGQRATLSVTMSDHPWSDAAIGYDKYYAERDYDPWAQGSYWGKFRARNAFVRGRLIRLVRGFVGQARADMEVRHFVIESFNGPTPEGLFTFVAKDMLKLADGDRAQAPVLSNGFLVAGITATDYLATLSPTGIGNEEYPASGYIAIGGKEIVAFARDVLGGNDANAKLLLHGWGVDATNVFTDSSASARTATAVGNVQHDTAVKYFGPSSILFDGTGDYITFPDSDDWTPAGDFSIDFRVRHSTLTDFQTYFTHFTDATNYYQMITGASGGLSFSVVSAGVAIVDLNAPIGSIVADGEFHDVAIVRVGNDYTLWVDGVAVATVNDASAIPNFTQPFRIGANRTGVNAFNGWMQEFRFSHVARDGSLHVAPHAASGDVLYITRAQFGTEAVAHEGEDRAQLCLHYEGEDPATIIADLLENYAGVPASYIPLSSWLLETDAYFRRLLTAFIAEPTPVKDLVSEIIEQAALAVWWDDIAQEVRLQVLRAIATEADTFDDDVILEGTFQSREQPDQRVSQVWTYYGQRNPLGRVDDPDNYRSQLATVDLQKESDYGSPAIRKVFSRWIPAFGRAITERLNNILLGRFVDPPRRFTFGLMRDAEIELGGGYQLRWPTLQDDTGQRINVPIQVTRLSPDADRYGVEAEEMQFTSYDEEDLDTRTIIIDSDALDFHLRDVYDTLFPDPESGDVVRCIIATGVTVGGSVLGGRAFDVGDWPAGVLITLEVLGRIIGRGGAGGDANQLVAGGPGEAGEAGGTGLYTRFPISFEGAAALVAGGGGGGGGGGESSYQMGAGGGGGGAGSALGTFGLGHNTGTNGTAGTDLVGGTGGGGTSPGGDGGDPGQVGVAGTAKGNIPGGVAGAAGVAVDGDSFVTYVDTPTFMGAQIN